MLKDVESCVAALYEGGWRSDDIEDIAVEYELNDDEANSIYNGLVKLEREGD